MSCTSTIQHIFSPAFSLPSKQGHVALRDDQVNSQPTSQEIWKWTLSSEAIASCFVRDVFAMRDSGVKDADFFWLGRVPCRSVRVVGLIVGVQVYETRIIYSVDDGTSVIDCFHRPSQSLASSAKRSHPSTQLPKEPPIVLKPIAEVGSSVRVIGKVTRWHDSRQINVKHIANSFINLELCSSPNDEPAHWKEVLALHKSSYSLPGPFIIPPAAPTSNNILTETLSEIQLPRISEPQTPSSSSAGNSSPISSAVSTPVKSSTDRSPPRLRHPSRLHSRDLTANTFRIYLKHYMDNAPPYSETHSASWLTYATTAPKPEPNEIPRMPSTPTKRSQLHNDHTPRQSKIGANMCDWTPRPIPAPVFVQGNNNAYQNKGKSPALAQDPSSATTRGFTSSYLRRVPELADMAKRVVKAEAKRRAREERKRVKEQALKSGLPPKESGGKSGKEELDIGPKMKRLFGWATVKLYEEGSIVLWDGPVRPCSDSTSTSGLWKLNSSTNTASLDSTVFSSMSGLSRLENDDDEGELSDPQPDEEAYIPLSPAYLAGHVEDAIGTLMTRRAALPGNTSSSSSSGRTDVNRAPLPGPTKEQITAFLRRVDGRWARVGEWAVGDALEVLRAEGKAWGIGGGRWELCR